MITIVFASCEFASVSLNVKNSGLPTDLISDIPLKPRTHPKNDVSVLLVYVIISSLIFKSPYFSGNPSVVLTLIISSYAKISFVKVIGDIGLVEFGNVTVWFSTREMFDKVDISLKDGKFSDRYVDPYSRSSDS